MLNATILTDFLIAVSGVSIAFGAGYWARRPVPPMSQNESVADGIDEEPGPEKADPRRQDDALDLDPGQVVTISARGFRFTAVVRDAKVDRYRDVCEVWSEDGRHSGMVDLGRTKAVVEFESLGPVVEAPTNAKSPRAVRGGDAGVEKGDELEAREQVRTGGGMSR